MSSSNNKLAKIALIAIPCAFAITTCSLTGCFGGDKSKGNSTPSPQAPAVTHSDTNGPNRVSTTGLVGNEVIGYLTVPVSWREFSSGLYAEQHSAFTSKISGAQLYERAVEASVANMTYA